MSVKCVFGVSDGRIFSFEMHHRYSDRVRKWSVESGKLSFGEWPVKGSVEYYTSLIEHDRILRGRRLSDVQGRLSFADGNVTYKINALGL